MHNYFPIEKLRYIFLFFLLSVIINPVFSNNVQEQDSAILEQRDFNTEALIRGERLFYGLVYPENKSINCAHCHNTLVSDTLNWNPDALEISKKYLDKSAADLGKVLLNPAGKKMILVHKGFQLSAEEVMLIKAYMDKLPVMGLKQHKPVVTNLFLFIIASILFLISITDLIISKKIKKQWIHLIVLTFTGFFITKSLVAGAISIGHSPGYAPDQPVKFSHAVHAGQNKTDCIYCHSYAPYSKSAGFPPENVCMNCHLLVRNGTRSGAFEIAKVLRSYEELKSIEWVKVYNLPDHVFFSHGQHAGAGGISCQECHGRVEKADRISLANELTMGWCINCHRTRNVNFRNNKFYTEYKDLSEKISKGETDSVTVENIGGTECMKCHY
jgi:hypothetical protein